MKSRNTGTWLVGGGVLTAAVLSASGSLVGLVDVNALFRLLDVLDAFPL